MSELTPEQIKNWREALSLTLGPYALIMPVEKVQEFRDLYQKRIDAFAGTENDKCDETLPRPERIGHETKSR